MPYSKMTTKLSPQPGLQTDRKGPFKAPFLCPATLAASARRGTVILSPRPVVSRIPLTNCPQASRPERSTPLPTYWRKQC